MQMLPTKRRIFRKSAPPLSLLCIQWDKDDRKLPVNMCSCVGRSKFRFEFHSEACSRILKHNLLAYYPPGRSPDSPYILFRPGYRKLSCLCVQMNFGRTEGLRGNRRTIGREMGE